MSAWPGKYVIGLTGNIATGKSVVRKMLEHLGAYGIDADALAHRVIAKDAPGYQPVIETFGRWILGPDAQVDRSKLARLVFSDPSALKSLEAIVHPYVRQAVDILVKRSLQAVVVIEAIKLLESPLRQSCDAIWVTCAAPEIQLMRLVRKRQMSEETARQRVTAQSSQQEKIAAAQVVIRNEGTFEDIWHQVVTAWQKYLPSIEMEPTKPSAAKQGELVVEKARPRQAAEIATFINRFGRGTTRLKANDIMEAFGEKAFVLLTQNNQLAGLIGWQVENLVARIDDVFLLPEVPINRALQVMINEVESASRDLQCEASLLFISPKMAHQESIWKELGYERRTIQGLGVRAWQEAAQETMGRGEVMLFKQLRQDRVLRPV